MLNNILQVLILIKYPLVGLLISFILISFYWERIFKCLNLNTYNNVQRVHKKEISRLGGLFIYLFLLALVLIGFIEGKFIFNILISAIPFVFISLKEDLSHNITPKLRLISMVTSCFIFFYINPLKFPLIDIPYLGNFISYYEVSIIFFTFSVCVHMNGMNLIDGMNGLFGYSALAQLLAIGLMANHINDQEVLNICILFALPLIIFLIFNYPFGSIFAGDLGAYIYGFANSVIVIYFFGKNHELMTWLGLFVVFYPCMEVAFSYARKKFFEKKDPFSPDSKHLHTLIYKKMPFKNNISKNSIVLIVLSPFVFFPLISLGVMDSLFYLFCYLICFSLLYLSFYLYLNRHN